MFRNVAYIQFCLLVAALASRQQHELCEAASCVRAAVQNRLNTTPDPKASAGNS